MDKKAIIAFVLIGLIIILWPLFFYRAPTTRKMVKQEKTAVKPPPKTLKERESPLPEGEGQQGAELQQPSAEFVARNIPIENDLVQGEISTKGGVITSWRLKEYKVSKGGENVELIPEGGKGLTLSVNEGSGFVDLSEAEFVPDREGLLLMSEETAAITLFADLGGGKRVEKRFEMSQGRHAIKEDVKLIGFDPGTKYRLGWKGGINATEKNLKEDLGYTKVYSYMGGVLDKFDCKGKKEKEQLNKGSLSGRLDWIAIRNKYFLISIIPADRREGGVDIWGRVGSSGEEKLYDFSFESESVEGRLSNIVYIGPIEYARLKQYGIGLEKVMDLGWPIIREFAKLFLRVFILMHRVIPNYGFVIIIFSVLIKIVVYPLTKKSYAATAEMQKLQPKLAALQQKYKNDKQRLNMEMMRLYKEHGVNPLGGCLPMLLQLPIFFALFNVFRSTIELRQAAFIPHWLEDLSQPDPYYILPLLMGATMFIQQKMTMKDPKQAAMVYIMPIMMVFIFLRFASGLVLYWTMFNVFSSIQQWLIQKRERLISAPRPEGKS